jgi:putative peptidoglycan lipid II flippase
LFELIRTLVFSQTVGASCVGTAYVTANEVPNLAYELILGGALTSAMIPVLARSAERADSDPAERAHVSQISSALLTWSIVILVPFTLIIAAAATPITDLLNPANANAHCDRAEVVSATSFMLVVCSSGRPVRAGGCALRLAAGVPPVHRLYPGPAVASLVVIASCPAFVPLSGGFALSGLPQALNQRSFRLKRAVAAEGL